MDNDEKISQKIDDLTQLAQVHDDNENNMSRTLNEILHLPEAIFSGDLTKLKEIPVKVQQDLSADLRDAVDFYKMAQDNGISQCRAMNLKVNPLFSEQALTQSIFNQDKLCNIALSIQVFQGLAKADLTSAQRKKQELFGIRGQLRSISDNLEAEVLKLTPEVSNTELSALITQAKSELKNSTPNPEKINPLKASESGDPAGAETLKTLYRIQQACYLKAATMKLFATFQDLSSSSPEDPSQNLKETLKLITQSAEIASLINT